MVQKAAKKRAMISNVADKVMGAQTSGGMKMPKKGRKNY